MADGQHQSQLQPHENKFHRGNGEDQKHYWITPPELKAQWGAPFGGFAAFDPCPYPLPPGFDGLTCDWGAPGDFIYVNPPFGSIMHQGKKKGPTAWARKAIEQWQKGRGIYLVYPIDKWVLMLIADLQDMGKRVTVRNLGDIRWLATEDGLPGKGTGRHIAAFILEPTASNWTPTQIRPSDPTSPVVNLYSKEKTLEYFNAAERDAKKTNEEP